MGFGIGAGTGFVIHQLVPAVEDHQAGIGQASL
jgi:hypothetical protein